MKAVSEKKLRSFFEPLLHRLQPSASKILNEEVLISLIKVKVEFVGMFNNKHYTLSMCKVHESKPEHYMESKDSLPY
jgi:hypothetical protein